MIPRPILSDRHVQVIQRQCRAHREPVVRSIGMMVSWSVELSRGEIPLLSVLLKHDPTHQDQLPVLAHTAEAVSSSPCIVKGDG